MERFVIQGGVPLTGKVKVEGSKNAALPVMAASLLIEGRCFFNNIPKLTDIEVMSKTLKELGADVVDFDGKLSIDASSLYQEEVSCKLARKLRASILVLGPLLARRGKVKVALPGGCNIGSRPINLHIEGLTKMGSSIQVEDGYIRAKARSGLRGAEIYLNFPSVGATENLLLAASLAKGKTVIKNASLCPEVVDLCLFLKKAGVKIEGIGTKLLTITGVKEIRPTSYSIIPDRIEAATLMIAAAITEGKICIEGVQAEHLEAPITTLRKIGVQIKVDKDSIQVERLSKLKATSVKTMPYPGFPTDLQPQITSLLCLAEGKSRITETIFENRFTHVSELKKMGAEIEQKGTSLLIKGVSFLKGNKVLASDIRGGAALTLAGLAARGCTEILNIKHIDRGYFKFEEKLASLGAKIKREKS